MAYQVEWSLVAFNDLNNIAKFIAYDSQIQADKIVSTFLELVANYGISPRAATQIPELDNEKYRHKHVFNWRVLYEIDDVRKVVLIHGILHNKRTFNSIYNRRFRKA